MSLFRPSREPRGEDPYLEWKMALFTIGAVLAVAGMVTDNRWLIGLAVVVLAAGVVLRFLRRG